MGLFGLEVLPKTIKIFPLKIYITLGIIMVHVTCFINFWIPNNKVEKSSFSEL
jgi:hypothetical protein